MYFFPFLTNKYSMAYFPKSAFGFLNVNHLMSPIAGLQFCFNALHHPVV